MSYADLIGVLERQFQQGDLAVQRWSRLPRNPVIDPQTNQVIPWVRLSDDFTPTHEEIRNGLEGKDPLYYGLTAQGGARWEEVSQPNWEQYLLDTSTALDDDLWQAEIISADRTLVEKYLHYDRQYEKIVGTETWDVLTPWEATYWKTLPVGYRLRYDFQQDEENFRKWDWDSEYGKWRANLQNWYTNYLETGA